MQDKLSLQEFSWAWLQNIITAGLVDGGHSFLGKAGIIIEPSPESPVTPPSQLYAIMP